MKINKETLQKTAHLARLTLNAEEEAQMQKDLEQILAWMDLLNAVDTEGVMPLMHMSEAGRQLREDSPKHSLETEKALSQAPTQDGQYFTVPKVIA